jgi:hypothetical protein
LRIVKRLGIAIVALAGILALSLASSPKLQAQTRITLTGLQQQINLILGGEVPTGRTGFATIPFREMYPSMQFLALNERAMSFTKVSESSVLKVTYHDEMFMQGSDEDAYFHLQILIDGTPVSTRVFYHDLNVSAGARVAVQKPLHVEYVGQDLPTGDHTVSFAIRSDGTNRVILYGGDRGFIQVEELP